MAKITIDNSGNIWAGTVTLADLASNMALLKKHSRDLDIYEVQNAFAAEWPFEIAEWEYEFLTGYSATFKDGSRIHVGAWADREDRF